MLASNDRRLSRLVGTDIGEVLVVTFRLCRRSFGLRNHLLFRPTKQVTEQASFSLVVSAVFGASAVRPGNAFGGEGGPGGHFGPTALVISTMSLVPV